MSATLSAKIIKWAKTTTISFRKVKKSLANCQDDILQHVKDVVNIGYLVGKGQNGYTPTYRKSYMISKSKLYEHCKSEYSTLWLYIMAFDDYDMTNKKWDNLPTYIKQDILNTFPSWDKNTAKNIGLYYGVDVAKTIYFDSIKASANFIK